MARSEEMASSYLRGGLGWVLRKGSSLGEWPDVDGQTVWQSVDVALGYIV